MGVGKGKLKAKSTEMSNEAVGEAGGNVAVRLNMQMAESKESSVAFNTMMASSSSPHFSPTAGEENIFTPSFSRTVEGSNIPFTHPSIFTRGRREHPLHPFFFTFSRSFNFPKYLGNVCIAWRNHSSAVSWALQRKAEPSSGNPKNMLLTLTTIPSFTQMRTQSFALNVFEPCSILTNRMPYTMI